MLTRLYLLLCAFLTLGADPPEGDPSQGDPPDDDLDLPDLEGDEADPPEGDPDDADHDDEDDPAVIRAQLATERKARETAERNAREASERATAAERARAQPAPPASADQQIFEHEEARLKASDCTPLEKWQIESNRSLRAQARTANQALMESREIADKADFDRFAASKPGMAKKYAARVESKLAEIRSQGGNLARKVVLKMLIGDDIVEGNVKTTKRAAPADAGGGKSVNRGKPAGARSDVRARGGQTEQDKRRARLENQIL